MSDHEDMLKQFLLHASTPTDFAAVNEIANLRAENERLKQELAKAQAAMVPAEAKPAKPKEDK